MLKTKQNILWLDCLGALVTGLLILVACRQISEWDRLPVLLTVWVGIAHLSYGAYSLFVATRRPRPIRLVRLLAVANVAWLFVCLAIIATNWSNISLLGVCSKLCEGVYVASLGLLEWKWRETLSERP